MSFFDLERLVLFRYRFTALHWMHGGVERRKLSVCLWNACIVIKQKKNLSRFLYH